MSDAEGAAAQTRIGQTVNPPIRIIPLDERHIKPARRLWDERFGRDEEHADAWLDDACIETEAATQGFVATQATQVVGFGIATVAGPDYVEDYVNVDIDVNPWEKTGILHILAVDEDYEGQGIGSDLVWHRLQWLATHQVGGVIGISWHREDHRDSRSLFEKFDFEAVATVEEYYAQLDGPTPCVDCEGDVCHCDATIYRRPLGGGDGD